MCRRVCDSGICYATDDVIESEEESDLRGGKTSHHSIFFACCGSMRSVRDVKLGSGSLPVMSSEGSGPPERLPLEATLSDSGSKLLLFKMFPESMLCPSCLSVKLELKII